MDRSAVWDCRHPRNRGGATSGGIPGARPDGRLLETIATDCRHTSSCSFHRLDERDLYITTSQLGLSATELAQDPLSGRLL